MHTHSLATIPIEAPIDASLGPSLAPNLLMLAPSPIASPSPLSAQPAMHYRPPVGAAQHHDDPEHARPDQHCLAPPPPHSRGKMGQTPPSSIPPPPWPHHPQQSQYQSWLSHTPREMARKAQKDTCTRRRAPGSPNPPREANTKAKHAYTASPP